MICKISRLLEYFRSMIRARRDLKLLRCALHRPGRHLAFIPDFSQKMKSQLECHDCYGLVCHVGTSSYSCCAQVALLEDVRQNEAQTDLQTLVKASCVESRPAND